MAADTTSTAGAGPAGPHGKKDANRRKMLIYGGLAAVMLVVYLMSRSSSSSSTTAADQTAADQAAAAQAAQQAAVDSGSLGSGAGGVDPSTDIGNIDSDLQQLSQQIAAEQSGATTPSSTTPGYGSYTDNSTNEGATVTTNYYSPVAPGPGGGGAARPSAVKPTVLKSAGKPATTSKGTHSAGLIGKQTAVSTKKK